MDLVRVVQNQLGNFPQQVCGKGFRIQAETENLEELVLHCTVRKVLLPAREGILIEDPETLPRQFDFSLTYPGSASMMVIVLFSSDDEGVLLGARPSLEYTWLGIRSTGNQDIQLRMESCAYDLVVLPFRGAWETAVEEYRRIFNLPEYSAGERMKPCFMLQIGIRDPFGQCGVAHFSDLLEPVERFREHFGPGQIMHFYGANEAGFDRMYPEMKISTELGGERGLQALNESIHSLGFQTSHHFNPRLADYDYVFDHPHLFAAAVRDRQGAVVMEPYAGHPFLVMNPAHPAWFEACCRSVEYLFDMGFDYVQLDQMTQQRNYYAVGEPVHAGLARLLEFFAGMGKNTWLEGLSDIHVLNPPDFFQILVRDHVRLWPDGELASGYPWGRSFPDFFRTVHPHQPLSFRVMTDTRSVSRVLQRLREAQRIGAYVYDLQMDYFHKEYMSLLDEVLEVSDDLLQALQESGGSDG